MAKRSYTGTFAEAVNHAAIAGKHDNDYGNYIVLNGDWIVGYDGIIAAGAQWRNTVQCAVDAKTLKHALKRAGNQFALTLYNDQLFVTGGDQRAYGVPTVDIGRIPGVGPDRGDRLQLSSNTVTTLLKAASYLNNKDELYASSVLMCRGFYTYVYNGQDMARFVHYDKLPEMEIPVEFMDAYKAVLNNETCSITFGEETITAWFVDGRWIQSRKNYEAQLDEILQHFNSLATQINTQVYPILSIKLAHELAQIKPFIVNDKIYVTDNWMLSSTRDTGAKIPIEHGLRPGCYSYASLVQAVEFGTIIRYTDDRTKYVWFGNDGLGTGTLLEYA